MQKVSFQIRFSGKIFSIEDIDISTTLYELKQLIFEKTAVKPVNQKLLGLKCKLNIKDDNSNTLDQYDEKFFSKIMLIGTTEKAIEKVSAVPGSVPDVVDDFDIIEELTQVMNMPVYLEKIDKRCKTYKMTTIFKPRMDKKLLVLDIDYTIFDHISTAQSASLLARPYLKEFLTKAYKYYDVAIWSATSMTWIVAKLGEIGVLSREDCALVKRMMTDGSYKPDLENKQTSLPYQVFCLVDSRAMISVHLEDQGVKEVKPLAVLWHFFPQFGPHNTIMFDDVRRNFIMNPQCGLRIHSYRDAQLNREKDTELLKLADYIELIALRESDFQRLNHDKWEKYLCKYGKISNSEYNYSIKDEEPDEKKPKV